ncbi:MAG: hypothetical protein ABIQ31_23095 [Ferruginibacter sp.]
MYQYLPYLTGIFPTVFWKQYEGIVFFYRTGASEPATACKEKKVSRLLGVTTILLPAAAILHALQVSHIGYYYDFFPPEAVLAGLLAIFFVLIKYDIAGKLFRCLVNRVGQRRANQLYFILLLHQKNIELRNIFKLRDMTLQGRLLSRPCNPIFYNQRTNRLTILQPVKLPL